jgi:hypothetical protein
MNRILGANGLPAGTPGPIARPGQQQCQISLGMGPGGPVLTLQMGRTIHPIPLPVEAARTLGVGLISLAALSEAAAQPIEPAIAGKEWQAGMPAPQADSVRRVEGATPLPNFSTHRGPEDDERKHDCPDPGPDCVGPGSGGEGPPDSPLSDLA